MTLPYGGTSAANYNLMAAILPGAKTTYDRNTREFAVAPTHFLRLVNGLAGRFAGGVEVTAQYRESERCHTVCQTAKPESIYTCVCSCGGQHHAGGTAMSGWHEVGSGVLLGASWTRRTYTVPSTT